MLGSILIGGLIVGLAARVKGGWRPIPGLFVGTQKGRIIFSLVVALVLAGAALAAGWHWLNVLKLGGLSLATAFLGAFIPHDPWQKIGAPLWYGGSNNPWYVVLGAVLGIVQLALLLLPILWLGGASWLLLAWAGLGALQSVVYLIGRQLGWPFLTVGTNGMIDAPTAWGELFFGIVLGAGATYVLSLV